MANCWRKDNTFISNSGSTLSALNAAFTNPYSFQVQSDGKIIIFPRLKYSSTTALQQYVQRLNSDGSWDTSYNGGEVGPNGFITTSYIENNDKVVIGKSGLLYNGSSVGYITRLTTGGTVDNTWNVSNLYSNSGVYSITKISTGEYVVSGTFTSWGGNLRGGIALLDSNGNLVNNKFTGTTGATTFLYVESCKTGGVFVASSQDTSLFDGTISKSGTSIFKLDNTGKFDVSFTGAPLTYVTYVKELSNNKILVGGRTRSFNVSGVASSAISEFYLYRLNSDGSIDNTFPNVN
jgi:uncharacterized delta-60 repeat protein